METIRIVAALLIFVTFPGNGESSIECYKCNFVDSKTSYNETVQLCNAFDHTSKYVVECSYSTMCMKKSFELRLPNGETIRGVERGCAPQKRDQQVYENGQWNLRSNIEEPYTEGCQVEDSKGARLAPPQYCYCRGHLCNSASSRETAELSYHVDAMAVIFVFNAIKYFRSLD